MHIKEIVIVGNKKPTTKTAATMWTIFFLVLSILAFFIAGPGWSVPFLFIVASNISFIFQKEKINTISEPAIDRERDGIISSEISASDFIPPSINNFSTFLIDGDDYYGKFFKVAERYIFISLNDRYDRKLQIKAINKLLASVELLESGFTQLIRTERIFKNNPAPNLRISTIEFIPEKRFDEFYVEIISDNTEYEYECLLRDFKFYDVSEIKN